MNRKLILNMVLAGLFCFFVLFAYASEKGSAEIVLNGGKIGNVPFPHQKHQQVLNEECSVCHSMFAQEKQVIDQMKKDGRLEKKKVMNHCMGCHRTLAKESKPAGPVKCKGCHSL